MSLILRTSLAANAQQKRVMERQFAYNRELQKAAVNQFGDPMAMILEKSGLAVGNKGMTPADAYLEMDTMTTIEMVPAGEHALLSRVLMTNRSVDLGKTVYEYRKASDAGNGQSSITGQIGVKLDHVDYGYGGAVIPIHDGAFGRHWRDYLAMKSDGFDALVDDAREKERGIMTTMDNYMWNGDAALVVEGKKWLGLKADPTVASATLAVNLAASATTAENIEAEVKRVRDILYITNNCTKGLTLVVSREIMSNWERVFSSTTGDWGTIYQKIAGLRGISSIVEDSALTGNQIALLWIDLQGFSSLIGQGMSTYALPRPMHNSDFSFIKWAATGFLSKVDFSGRKCALYAQ